MAKVTKMFDREFLLNNILWGSSPEGKIILDEVESTGRWSIYHRLIFELNGELWETSYSVGATEMQDECPWDYESEVECVKVAPVEKTVTVYEPVDGS